MRAGFDAEIPLAQAPDVTFRLDATGQFTTARLPAGEEFILGGREQQRGFRFAEAQGDSGLSVNFEVGRDFIPETGAVLRARPFAFADFGQIWNNDPSMGEVSDIALASAGFGVELQLNGDLFIRTHMGFPLTDGVTQTTRDPAVYLGITRSW
ncbi:ShlB/FhaC/HecB family hemolysin secretion/activation protein [Rhodophyticola porphyridii]|uniref:ShlB/FhaC/HecB family hemolysin secretion/activation protein n=1 Tax=Rhodophyticola porphyridii TaxID=1852017 RepID=UPI0035D03F98